MAQEEFNRAFKREGRTLKGDQAQGSIELDVDGNIVVEERTSRWSKALWSGERRWKQRWQATTGRKRLW
jgi:hypothetical protein